MSVKIFISCVSDEFRAYRDQLAHRLRRLSVEVIVQEDFRDLATVTLDMLDAYVCAADAVVHLIGDMTGAAPKPASTRAILDKYPDIAARFPPLGDAVAQDDKIPYTQWEAWLALYHGKALLIALAGTGAVTLGPAFAPTDDSRASQQTHLDRLRDVERYPGCTFVNADQLVAYVLSTPVLELLVKQETERLAKAKSKWGDEGWLPFIAFAVGMLVLLVTPSVSDQWAKTFGIPIATPLAFMLAVGGFALPLMYLRYFFMLDASDERVGSRDWRGYDTLRRNLATEGRRVALYARWLTAFLDSIDRFFGDAGIADRTLFPQAFGLKRPAPLWTAPAFDRCLLLALAYPVAIILIIWAMSGHVGPAEAALKLQANVEGWQRGAGTALLGVSIFSSWRWMRTEGWAAPTWFVSALAMAYFAAFSASTGSGALAVANVIALSVAGTFFPIASGTSAGLFVALGAGVGAFAGIAVTIANGAIVGVFAGAIGAMIGVAIGMAVGAVVDAFARALAHAFTSAFAGFGIVAISVVVAVSVSVSVSVTGATKDGIVASAGSVISYAPFALAAAVAILNDVGIQRKQQGIFLLLYLFGMVIFCFGAALWLPSWSDWSNGGPLLLFLGLLTLFNAPFDWACLGLTRALLRRGLELGGWWPYFLALVDAVAAAVVIAVLALTMVVGVQTFDALAVHGGGKAVLPLTPLFDGIDAHPDAPEYWWVYALLLSTMIPSLINLAIGGTALMRAVPGLPSLLLRFLPATGGVPAYDRAWIAAVLTLQAALGAVLGVAVQALVAWAFIFHGMPAVGLGLLDVARGLAELDLPTRLIHLIAGAP